MTEAEFIAALRLLPLHPGARGLADDAAVVGGLVVTMDTLVEGVHFRPHDDPADVAWKLVATNLSDLAAKGARVEGAMVSYPLGDDGWDRAFLDGLGHALRALGCPLIGGDTVSLPLGAPRVLTLTALGSDAAAPARDGARVGDALWVTGTIGDAGAGLVVAADAPDAASLVAAYTRPQPRLAEGRALARHVHAMMDVSDGLLVDAQRMAAASGVAIAIDLAHLPLSDAYRRVSGDRLAAATAGDDYELLFAAPQGWSPPVAATRIGEVVAGAGLALYDDGLAIPLPASLGYQHRGR